jgi:DNA helicase-2/ATP-dependent DNA helicase PcrA
MFGQPNFNRRSRFLEDIPDHLLDAELPAIPPPGLAHVRQERSGDYSVKMPSMSSAPVEPAPKKPDWIPPFGVGDRVQHGKFGTGVVIACAPLKNDAEVTVAFPGVVGVKKLVQSLAKLEMVSE